MTKKQPAKSKARKPRVTDWHKAALRARADARGARQDVLLMHASVVEANRRRDIIDAENERLRVNCDAAILGRQAAVGDLRELRDANERLARMYAGLLDKSYRGPVERARLALSAALAFLAGLLPRQVP